MASDPFSSRYSDLLDGAYDCADRIVLRAYFGLGCNPGGFRVWWRTLMGDDSRLDDTRLMRLAGRFSRRLRAHAHAHGIPVINCQPGERKAALAERYRPSAPDFRGVFLIQVSRAPAPVWHVERNARGEIRSIAHPKRMPFVNHFSFHIIDPDWGHVIIRMCGHPPFSAMVILNGHEYVARQCLRRGVAFTKEGNCFTDVSNAADLANAAETLRLPSAIGRLRQVCERWIYSSCLCFALDSEEREKSGFRFSYAVCQAEYSRNLLFRRGRDMERVFQGTVDRTRASLHVRTLTTIFGCRTRPFRRNPKLPPPRLETAVERPAYDLTVFKIHFGKITLKIYTKGERVLRAEVIVHNARELRCGTGLDKFPDILGRLSRILERFLEVLSGVDAAFIDEDTLEDLPKPARIGRTRVGGVDTNKRRMRAVLEAVIALAPLPDGFSVSDLADKVRPILKASAEEYTLRQAAYDLRKLRAKGLVRRADASRRYRADPTGLRTAAALVLLREKVIVPLLANDGRLPAGPRPITWSAIDEHYRNMRLQMQCLFKLLGIAA